MDLILNIGLAREGNSNIGSGTVIREVIEWFGAASFSVHHSDTELTVVACVGVHPGLPYQDLENRVEFMSRRLGQDCIAVYAPAAQKGALIGPRAADWGPFNPEFFLMPDGTRLSDRNPSAKAA